MNIAIILLAIDWLIFNYVFKYQRVTLILSRIHRGLNSAEYQALLTPNWIGIMGWLVNILHILSAIAFFITYGWIIAVLYLILSFVGYGLIDVVIPLPSTHYYFRLIKKSLGNDIKNSKNTSQKKELDEILQKVKDTEKVKFNTTNENRN